MRSVATVLEEGAEAPTVAGNAATDGSSTQLEQQPSLTVTHSTSRALITQNVPKVLNATGRPRDYVTQVCVCVCVCVCACVWWWWWWW